MKDKPPIGLKPEHVWRFERVLEIMEAQRRYLEAGQPTLDEWTTEQAQHLDWLNERARGMRPKK